MDLTIPRRYCGPPESGNGGWVSGTLAALLPRTGELPGATVRLSAPPPLDRPLTVALDEPDAVTGGASLRLLDGDLLVASAAAAPAPDGDLPPGADLEEARAAEERYEGLVDHPFPTCFACGTGREPGDALCLRPGPLADGTGRYAAVWSVPADGADEALVWAALDCPGGWSAGIAGRPMVLGTMAAVALSLPEPGAPHVVTAWQRGAQGRRHLSGSALHAPDGTLLARAEATWVAVDPAAVRPKETP